MKLVIGILAAIALPSCTVTENQDGTTSTHVDGQVVADIITIIAEK